MSKSLPRPVRVVAFDVDGTLTDATTWYGGPEVGWCQVYSVRDGEALLRLRKRGVVMVPLSRNKTQAARTRMELLGCELRWLGVSDKAGAFREICEHYGVPAEEVLTIGDGPDDAVTFALAGVGVAVADAHREAVAASSHVLASKGGDRALEELEHWLEETGRVADS